MTDSHSALSNPSNTSSDPQARTPLYDLHIKLGARMVPFAGYLMPVHYPTGILTEHLHTREKCGLFDVSHMGQAALEGESAAALFETLVPGDISGLAPGKMRYTQFLDETGGILDDLMVTRLPGSPERLFIVCNASMKAQDFAHVRAKLPSLSLDVWEDRALIALQGPKACDVLEGIAPGVRALTFMTAGAFAWRDTPLLISRSGYTGEDGFEISLPASLAQSFAERLLSDPDCAPIGLGARDSLRLEAGLCLYGHDIDTTTDPIEAGLAWSIAKRRREAGGFPGQTRIQHALQHASADGPRRLRIGLELAGRAPAREGAEIAAPDGKIIGKVTSGGFSPSLGRPIAMGYVEAGFSAPGTEIACLVRGKALPARVTRMPFFPHRYFKG